MAFRGLFIGIDRYASPQVNWLSCARRDATALHALFTDSLGGDSVLLRDEEATRAAIERGIAGLSGCAEDDVVVIAFSGHGTDTHELVTYDANLADLRGTCIPLETLTEWIAAIPARRMVCVLDCCFSGGAGAKVLHAPAVPRGIESADRLLDRLSGEGRLVLTASLATEEALEAPQYRHGLLTYHLLQALQGAEEVVQAGKVSIYRLLEYVTRRVTDAAAGWRHDQHPTLRGTVDGEFAWPVLKPGPLFRSAFPDHSAGRATADIASLASFGLPPGLLAAWSGAIPGLNSLQVDAVNEYGILAGESLVVSAPTSSGKTMIGELAAVRGALERRRALFLLPLKALVNDKHAHFTRTYGGFGLRVIRATGDMDQDVPLLLRGQYDICLMTYEKFSALALGRPEILRQVGTIVVDEVQMIADESRGVNLEFVMTLLRVRRREGVEPQLVLLSAVIGDTNGLERWMGAQLLRRTERPVPLDEGVLRGDGSFRYVASDTGTEAEERGFVQRFWRKNTSQDWVIPLVSRLVAEGKQVIVFRETRGEARGCARYLAAELALPAAEEALASLPTGDPSLASHELRQTLSRGVAFHISDLDREERAIVEEQFRLPNSPVRVIAATTTLAMGVNTPAEAVVIVGLQHPPDRPYSVAEYKNIAGRAGRLGYTTRGTSYLLALTPHEEAQLWDHYVKGQPESLESRFLSHGTDPRSLVLRVLVAGQYTRMGMAAEEIAAFLEDSFGIYQERQAGRSDGWKRDALPGQLAQLATHGLVEADADGRYHLTELGRAAGEGGLEVESVIRLVAALGGVPDDAVNDPVLLAATQLTVELDDVEIPLNKKSTLKEPEAWFGELGRQGVPRQVLLAMQRCASAQHEPTARAKKAVACLLWASGMPMARIEDVLTQFGGRFNGAAGAVRAVTSRTVDVLPVVVRIAAILHPGARLAERCARLLVRLELGVPSAAVELATQAGNRLSRSDYLALAGGKLCDPVALADTGDDTLLSCLGGNKEKLAALRDAARDAAGQGELALPPLPIYEP